MSIVSVILYKFIITFFFLEAFVCSFGFDLTADVIGSPFPNEVALHQPPAPLLPPALPPVPPPAPAAGGVMWKSVCDDAVVMPCQLPQHYVAVASYNSYNTSSPSCAVASNVWPWPSPSPLTPDNNVRTPSTHCKTSTRRRNTERHKDRVTLRFVVCNDNKTVYQYFCTCD